MSEPAQAGPSMEAVEDILREELAHGDVIIATARPILRHLLANDDHALFSDEVIARVRGMMVHVARQMLFVLADEAGVADRAAFADAREEAIAVSLLEDSDLLGHAHALCIEAQIALRLQHRSGIDAVLSPLLQELAASSDQAMAAAAMRVLSAQARYRQQQHRMEFPLSELPQALFDRALAIFASHTADMGQPADLARASLQGAYDPDANRIGRILRLVSAMQHRATRALEVDHAGVSIFVVALSLACGQNRDTVILSLGENQCARLALSLRAAGLGQKAVEEQFLYLHPEIELPDGFDRIRVDRASAMLAAAQVEEAM
ncbi:hypothetical protein GRI62_05645 [Erythrobacter arachoides]|uniref:DUF2336 domain-containing protein n=1 Tax=Aurantiacibacter arachoides TaxID=1850444 RepID=A0A845A6B8_9SPHN|nr:hypothetical protein [Aurantiacibacter arachoides]MXO93089.1 hypothetical protein [Aurantiacibacter arachoides]